MTLKEAGDIYNTQTKKMAELKKNIDYLTQLTEAKSESGEKMSTCIVRTDILRKVISQLNDQANHIMYVLNKELTPTELPKKEAH